MRAPLTSTGDRRSGRGCRVLPDDEREQKPSFRTRRHGMRKSDGLLGREPRHPTSILTRQITCRAPSSDRPRTPARKRRRTPHSPIGSRVACQAPAGGPLSPSASFFRRILFPRPTRRASRLSAGTSRSRVAVRRLGAGLPDRGPLIRRQRRTGADPLCPIRARQSPRTPDACPCRPKQHDRILETHRVGRCASGDQKQQLTAYGARSPERARSVHADQSRSDCGR